MGFDDCYQLGYIQKTHALRGEVIAHFDSDNPESYKNLESVFLNISGNLVPFFLKQVTVRGKGAIIRIDDINSIEEAQELIGKELWLPLDRLPDLEEGQFYYHELIGYKIFNEGEYVGDVEQIYELPKSYLLGINHKGKEVLIPTNDEVLLEVQKEHKRINTKLPEGLIDLYTEENED